MKAKFILFSLISVFLLYSYETVAQSDIESARTSVVKIKTKYSIKNKSGKVEPKAGTATGFCWQNPLYVVTALHAVAGVTEIIIYKNDGKYTTAKVVKALLEADLALLQLTADLGLKPLALAEVNANAGKRYTIWGFPHAVYKIQDNEVRLSRSVETSPILDDIINGDDLKYQLEKQKYPSTRAKILKIGSTIQPGQSGAPLFTSDGKVVGVADGGLRGGTALLNWGMPANYYVPRLYTSQDLIPGTVSMQSSLYSSSTTIPENATDEEVTRIIIEEAKENTVTLGNKSITKSWTASFEEIMATMPEQDKADIEAMVSEFGINLSDTYYDIYEDYETGATVSIPYGANFDIKDGWFYTCNANASLCYYVLPFDAATYQNAKTQTYALFNNSFPADYWVYDPGTPDLVEEYDQYEEASYTLIRQSADGSGREVEFTAEIYGSDLLVAFMIYNPNLVVDSTYLKQFFHFSIAMEMRDFAGE
ncbi:MAG: serine protease [Bacteroidota bacterium]